jgi:hypothetical protein
MVGGQPEDYRLRDESVRWLGGWGGGGTFSCCGNAGARGLKNKNIRTKTRMHMNVCHVTCSSCGALSLSCARARTEAARRDAAGA